MAPWQRLVDVALFVGVFAGRTSARARIRSATSLGSGIATFVNSLNRALVQSVGEPSVGGVGDRYHTALAETINGLFKADIIHRRGPWRSFDAVEYATLDWVDWFKARRLREPIRNFPSAEAKTNVHIAMENQPGPHNQDQSVSEKPGAVHLVKAAGAPQESSPVRSAETSRLITPP